MRWLSFLQIKIPLYLPVWYLTERLYSDNYWVSYNKKLQWLIECVGWYLFVFLVFRPPTGEKAFDILLMSRARGLETKQQQQIVQCGISQAGVRCWQAFLFWFLEVFVSLHTVVVESWKGKDRHVEVGGRNERRRVVFISLRRDSWGESSQIPLTVTLQLC